MGPHDAEGRQGNAWRTQAVVEALRDVNVHSRPGNFPAFFGAIFTGVFFGAFVRLSASWGTLLAAPPLKAFDHHGDIALSCLKERGLHLSKRKVLVMKNSEKEIQPLGNGFLSWSLHAFRCCNNAILLCCNNIPLLQQLHVIIFNYYYDNNDEILLLSFNNGILLCCNNNITVRIIIW